MANYNVLFGGAQPQQANVAGAMNQGGLDAQKMQASRQALAAAPVALEGQKLQNQSTRRSLDMSASQSLSNTFKQLAAIPDDNKRNQIYKSIVPHLKRLSPDRPYPDTLSAEDADMAAQAFAMAGSGGITKEQLEQRRIELMEAKNTAYIDRTKAMQGGGVGPQGKSVDAWAYNTLLSGDPNSKEFAAAKAHLSRASTQLVQTDQGLMPVNKPPVDLSWSGAQDFPGANLSGDMLPPVAGAPGVVPGTAPRPTVEQGNASGFYARMVNSNKIIDELESKGYSPGVKDFVTSGGKWTSALTSEEGQMYRQAQENWVRANLRKESGAAIPEGEMEAEIKNYFPMPGDKPATIKQKAQNRNVVTDAMRMAAGPGAKTVDSKYSDNVAAPQTQADYDALPSGAIFVDPDDGKQYRKP